MASPRKRGYAHTVGHRGERRREIALGECSPDRSALAGEAAHVDDRLIRLDSGLERYLLRQFTSGDVRVAVNGAHNHGDDGNLTEVAVGARRPWRWLAGRSPGPRQRRTEGVPPGPSPTLPAASHILDRPPGVMNGIGRLGGV